MIMIKKESVITSRKVNHPMKSHGYVVALMIIGGVGMSLCAVDQNPKSNGNTLSRNASGNTYEAAFHNPAVLGVDQAPTGGFMVFPFSDIGFALWSDKLALSWFDNWATKDSLKRSQMISNLLARSFNITDEDNWDTSGRAVSDKLTKGFKGGFKVYAGARSTLLNVTRGRIGIDLTTHFDEQLNMPEGPLYLLFSSNQGLLRGNTLDFSTFKQQATWATDLTFSAGLPVTIPVLHEFFGLPYGAGGIGVKYVMGHALLNAQMTKGSVVYKSAENKLGVDGEANVQAAGDFVHGDFIFNKSVMAGGLPINGHGLGLDIGGILYDDNTSLSVNFQNLGVLFWINNTREMTKRIKHDGLDFYDIVDGFKVAGYNNDRAIHTIFKDGNSLSGASDTFHTSTGFATSLPFTLNIGYAKRWVLTEKSAPTHLWEYASYASGAVNYEQSLAGGPGRSYVPRFSFGSELGAAKGVVPLRLGLILGGPERFASAAGFGIDFKYASFQFSYKAIGNILLIPSNGMEIAAGFNFNWGMKAPEHKKPFVAPPPVHDTVMLRDTVTKKDTLVQKDTVKVKDTIIQLKFRPTEKEEKALNKELKAVNFQTASAELLTDSYNHLNLIAEFLKKYPYLKYEVQGHTDGRGDDLMNLLLSAARAGSVRSYLISQGIPDSSVIAIGYGKTKPIGPNTTASGRAQNRRVQFVVIETNDEYIRLKALEKQFQEQVKEAQIKGVR
jgi:outer membrane protein OmpA-like peptidoglycan-associated protein